MSESVLNKIVTRRRLAIAEEKQKSRTPNAGRRTPDANQAPDGRSLAAAMRSPGLGLIAEVKTASPSKGTIRADFSVSEIVRQYERAGASAISVLTEPDYFNGRWSYIREAKEACGLPIMCKDFIVDKYQLEVARANGADAVLLIAAVLNNGDLAEMIEAAHELGLEVLTEAIDRAELERVLAGRSDVIGINNRNLHTLEVDMRVGVELLDGLPSDRPVVVESGIFTRRDVKMLESKGADGILVGTSVMQSDDIEGKIRELLGA